MNRKEPTVYRRTLARAVEVAGTEEKLAAFLAVPPATLRSWSVGASAPSLQVFLALVDIVAANHLSPLALRNLNPRALARRL
jgi:DNA-binding transcriptional regulator YdaS (Cro superfamily)